MLDQAINDLKERIRATSYMLKDHPGDNSVKQELYALVSAVNLLEIYEYGKHQTKFNDYVNK